MYQTEPMSLRNNLESYQVMVLSRLPKETIMRNPVECDGLFIHSYKKYLLRPAVCEKPSLQFSSVTQSCPTLCDPMDCSTPGFPIYHQLLELAQTHVHRVSDANPSISSSVVPFSSCLQSFPALGFFPMSQFFASRGQSFGASASVLSMNIQG